MDALFPRRRWRRRGHRVVLRTVLALDGLADTGHARSRSVHLHRVTRDIQADASRHAVRLPGRSSFGVAALDETVVVRAMAGSLTSAKARHVVEHLRMTRGEGIDRLDDLGRTRRRIIKGRNRRQRPVVGERRRRERHDGHWRFGRCGRWGRYGGLGRGVTRHRFTVTGRTANRDGGEEKGARPHRPRSASHAFDFSIGVDTTRGRR